MKYFLLVGFLGVANASTCADQTSCETECSNGVISACVTSCQTYGNQTSCERINYLQCIDEDNLYKCINTCPLGFNDACTKAFQLCADDSECELNCNDQSSCETECLGGNQLACDMTCVSNSRMCDMGSCLRAVIAQDIDALGNSCGELCLRGVEEACPLSCPTGTGDYCGNACNYGWEEACTHRCNYQHPDYTSQVILAGQQRDCQFAACLNGDMAVCDVLCEGIPHMCKCSDQSSCQSTCLGDSGHNVHICYQACDGVNGAGDQNSCDMADCILTNGEVCDTLCSAGFMAACKDSIDACNTGDLFACRDACNGGDKISCLKAGIDTCGTLESLYKTNCGCEA